ncbi:hypothetical protein MVES1_003991 [Malassezia vespertilionis]|uniref:Uncharacterized protein n=1 Tax=Malassezia vespertilionis TaxID=2020962 RepID=A0A2N1J833_9BASI|nr:uncharacterized protein MVES1_003991 [Malassezia vespertilionis]PKI82715.1 hypothetical protein MVES_003541 [Malassezia vespertilionis]WFD08615.1 hypothetical protein MVES1_003991 [Malassezia vespertilionis]
MQGGLEPPSPQRDATYVPKSPKRSLRNRLSNQIERVRGRSPGPANEQEDDALASPSKRLGVSRLLRRSAHRARSLSPAPSRSSVVYDENAPEYHVPELPNWQLYDGSNTQLGSTGFTGDDMCHNIAMPGFGSNLSQHIHVANDDPNQPNFLPLPLETNTVALFGDMAPPDHRRSGSISASAFVRNHRSADGAMHQEESVHAVEEGAQFRVEETVERHVHEAAFSQVEERVQKQIIVERTQPLPPPPPPKEELTAADIINEAAMGASAEASFDETAENTVIDYDDTKPQRTNLYSPRIPHGGKPWREFDHDQANDSVDAGRLYSRRMVELGLPHEDTENIVQQRTPSGNSKHKQERLLDAMQREPEGAKLTDLMNRVVQPRQSWLRGIWPSGASQCSDRTASAKSGGIVFQGADASPSLYSNDTMSEFDDGSRVTAASPRSLSGANDRINAALARAASVASKRSEYTQGSARKPSDDECEALEMKRKSILEARRILESERRHGSAELQGLDEEAPPLPPPKTPKPEPPTAGFQSEEEAQWYAQQEAEWYAQQEAEWLAQEQAYYAQQEAEWYYYQQAMAAHGLDPGALQPDGTMPRDEYQQGMIYQDMQATEMMYYGRENELPPLPRSTAPVHRKAPPAFEERPRVSTMMSTTSRGRESRTKKRPEIPVAPLADDSASTIIEEDGTAFKPDGFGGLIPVYSADETPTTPSSRTTPKAPQVESMHHDFTRRNERPTSGLPKPMQQFKEHIPLPGTTPKPNDALQRFPSRREPPKQKSNAPFRIASEVYTTPAVLQDSRGRLTWTPALAEAAAKYIQSMTESVSYTGPHPPTHSVGAANPATPSLPPPTQVPPPETRELALPTGMVPSKSVVEQLQSNGISLVIDAGTGAEPKDLPLHEALQEVMVRFYMYERHSVPVLRELDKRLVALEQWSLLDADSAKQPPWNQEAVARITSEVRREMRALMLGVKQLHESRSRLQEITRKDEGALKRKRTSDTIHTGKRAALSSRIISTSSIASSTGAASSRYASGSSTMSASSSDTVLQVTPFARRPVSPAPSLGPRPLPTKGVQREVAPMGHGITEKEGGAVLQEDAKETAPVEQTAVQEAASTAQDETSTEAATPKAEPLAESVDTTRKADAFSMPCTDAEEFKDAPTDTNKSPEESSAEPAPRQLMPVKPRYADSAAESGLLFALMRANERAHTPPPPPLAEHNAPASTPNATEKDATHAREKPTARIPLASKGNSALAAPSKPTDGVARTPSALRARAQRYLKHTDPSAAEKVAEKVPVAAHDAEYDAENVSPQKYQPTALSASLRRRMAKFEA